MLHTVVAGRHAPYALAQKIRLRAETLIWANNMELNPDLLRTWPEAPRADPSTPCITQWGLKDTVRKHRQKYKAKPADIIAYKGNTSDPKNPAIKVWPKAAGPGAAKPIPQKLVKIYSGPSPLTHQGHRPFRVGQVPQDHAGLQTIHRAVDIAGWTGSPGQSRRIRVTWWNPAGAMRATATMWSLTTATGTTLYGHLSRIFVTAGNSVAGGCHRRLGSSGPRPVRTSLPRSQRGVLVNPFGQLP